MRRKFILYFIVSIISFVLIFTILEKKSFKNDSIPTVDNSSGEINLGEDNTVEQKVDDEILFLIMGVDANGTKTYKGIRTDTMMLFKVNFGTGETNLISIPRDTRVLVKGKNDKITHAHSIGGPELTMITVREFLNLDIDYYVKVDFNAVMEIVDAIGGVEIDVPRNMEYTADPTLNINIKKGLQVLDGKNAHDFLRWRHNNDMTLGYVDGDVGRIQAQQMFMKEFIKQTLQIKNITKLPKIIKTYYKNVETNIPMDVILQGAKLATKLDMNNINTETIPGEGEYIGGTSYYVYAEKETEELIMEVFDDYLLNE